MKILFVGNSTFDVNSVMQIVNSKQWELHYYPLSTFTDEEKKISEIPQKVTVLDTQALEKDLLENLLKFEQSDTNQTVLLYDGNEINLGEVFQGGETNELRSVISHDISTDVDDQKQGPDREAGLTKREREILGLICEELTNKEIAERLEISDRTVDSHRRTIILKTGANNTAGLVKYAIKNNICTI